MQYIPECELIEQPSLMQAESGEDCGFGLEGEFVSPLDSVENARWLVYRAQWIAVGGSTIIATE
jgi:hypothetical protein